MTITIVKQGATENTSATTSVTVTMPSNSLAIVACYNDSGGTNTWTCAATGLVFRLLGGRPSSGSLAIFVAEVVTGASYTFNVTHSLGSVIKRVVVCSAIDSSGNIPDCGSAANANNGASSNSLGYTSAGQGSVGLFMGYTDSGTVAGAVTGETLLDSHGAGDFMGAGTEDTFLYLTNSQAPAVGTSVTMTASSVTNACAILEITNAYTTPSPNAVSASVYNTSSTKTVAVSVNAGDVIAVFGVLASSTGVLAAPTGGSGLTWTQQQSFHPGSYSGLHCWTAISGSTQSFSVSVALASGTDHFGIMVAIIPGGTPGNSATANASTGAAAVNLTPNHKNSVAFCMVGDWNASSVTTRTWKTINSFTPTAGNGKEITAQQDSGQYSSYAAWWTSMGAPAVNSVGMSAPTNPKWTIVALEVAGVPTASTIVTTFQPSEGFFAALT